MLTPACSVLKAVDFSFRLFPPLDDFQLVSELGTSLESNHSK
jgi:hypothetical protein